MDRFCAEAEKEGIKIIRDKTDMRYGDSISKFMDRLAQGDRIFVFLSAKYLKSAFCMNELHQIWRNCSEDGAKFIDRTRIYVLPCANIKTMEERAEHAKYWRDELKRLERLVKKHDLRDIADEDIADYRFMSEFANKTANILRLVQDTLRPQSFGEFVKYGFDDPPRR